MVSVSKLLNDARRACLSVRVEGERLVVHGPRAGERIARQLLARKPEVISILRQNAGPFSAQVRNEIDEAELVAERIAIQWVESLAPEDAQIAIDDVFPPPVDWWNYLSTRDLDYLTSPRKWPNPCPWCGGRLHHSQLCDELRASWQPVMPFGKHAGMPVDDVPQEYLRWFVRKIRSIDSELRAAIDGRLQTVAGTPRSVRRDLDPFIEMPF